MALPDPWASQKEMWRSFGQVVGKNPLVDRDGIIGIAQSLEIQALTLWPVNPWLAKVLDDMAAEFYASALDALNERLKKKSDA